jgi:hypothetical protein
MPRQHCCQPLNRTRTLPVKPQRMFHLLNLFECGARPIAVRRMRESQVRRMHGFLAKNNKRLSKLQKAVLTHEAQQDFKEYTG